MLDFTCFKFQQLSKTDDLEAGWTGFPSVGAVQ
jgi:hypothetical protein